MEDGQGLHILNPNTEYKKVRLKTFIQPNFFSFFLNLLAGIFFSLSDEIDVDGCCGNGHKGRVEAVEPAAMAREDVSRVFHT